MSHPLPALATRVGYRDLRDYLAARGWTSSPSQLVYAAIYRSPGGHEVEIQIPLDTTLADYSEAMDLAARRLANFEHRPPGQVLRDLLAPRYDVVRYALADDALQAGTLGLLMGASLVSGAVKSLLASACSVRQPRRFHPRMTLADADHYIRACQLGQTEIGSYVLTIDTPLELRCQLDTNDEIPFGRRATSLMLGSTDYIARSIRRGDAARILDEDADAPPVSANLCEALVEMMPSDESADLRLSGSWSPLVPPPADVPVNIHLDRSMFEPIEQLAQQLRPKRGSESGQFVGTVIELSGIPNPMGTLEGDVVLQIQSDDQLVKARITLDPESYRAAGKAHFEQRYVSVRGQLHRGRRTNSIRNPSQFTMLPT
jgi:hypothetical protein